MLDSFVDGKPRFHLPSARNIHFSDDASQFFITTHQNWLNLSDNERQAIYADRHIVVTGCPTSGIKFDAEGVSTLGRLYTPREIQGTSSFSEYSAY